jgi:hypothetical protein
LFDISLETFAVDWTVEDAGRIDAFAAQRRHEGQGFPMAGGTLAWSSTFLLWRWEKIKIYVQPVNAPLLLLDSPGPV